MNFVSIQVFIDILTKIIRKAACVRIQIFWVYWIYVFNAMITLMGFNGKTYFHSQSNISFTIFLLFTNQKENKHHKIPFSMWKSEFFNIYLRLEKYHWLACSLFSPFPLPIFNFRLQRSMSGFCHFVCTIAFIRLYKFLAIFRTLNCTP